MCYEETKAYLLEAIQENKYGNIIDIGEQLVSISKDKAMNDLLRIFKAQKDPRIIQCLVAPLGHFRDEQVFEAVLDMVESPLTKGYRGNLVAYLSRMDCSGIVPNLAKIIAEDTYESAARAYDALSDISGDVPIEDAIAAKEILKKAVSSIKDRERRKIIKESLKMFY